MAYVCATEALRQQCCDGPPGQFPAVVPEEPLRLRVGPYDEAIRIDDDDAVRHGFQKVAKPRFNSFRLALYLRVNHVFDGYVPSRVEALRRRCLPGGAR